MEKIFDFAAKVNSIWTIASFAIAGILYLVLKGKQKPWVIVVAVGAVVLLGLVPIIADFFSQKIYRITVTVLDESGSPTDQANVSSNLGGERKKVENGWELDINPQTIPQNKKITIYAKQQDAYLAASQDTVLGNDYNFTITLKLKKNTNAKVAGTVTDIQNHGLPDATVYIDGYATEAIKTGDDGRFNIPSHSANNERVRICAKKLGYQDYSNYFQAGDNAIGIILTK